MNRELLKAGQPPAAADAPIGALLECGEELTRAWLAQLMSCWPLDRIAELPLSHLALFGPGVCCAALHALAGDEALARVGDRSGAFDALAPEQAVRAVEALRQSLWAALLRELGGAQLLGLSQGSQRQTPGDTEQSTFSVERASRVAQLADRLGLVCATLAAAAVADPAIALAARSSTPAPAPVQGPEEAPQPRRLREAGSTLDGDPDFADASLVAIARRVDLRARDGRPFAVLLVEVDGLERLVDAELDGEVAAALARAERVLLTRLRPADELLREQAGRYWVLAPDTDARGADLLAWEFAAAPRMVGGHRGVSLSFSVGIALCPQHGEQAGEIAERAESALLEARSAGVGVTPT